MSGVVNSAFRNVDRRLVSFQKKANKVANASANIGRTAGSIGAGIGAPLVLAAKKAIDFEESMADVSKVLNLKQGSAELNRMGEGAQRLAVHLAKAPSAAAAMIAALAQGGTAKNELFDIGKFTGEMSVAFDIMAASAGDSFTKTKNALGATTEQTKKVMNAINFLSDNSAAKASQILTFMASGGAGSARALKISGQEVASLGAFFVSMGKSGSEAATIVSRLTKGLQKNSKVGKLFRSSGGGLAGLMAVLEKGNKLDGAKRFKFFASFGQYGQDIALAAANMKQLKATTGLVANETQFANSVAAEFANRSNTRAFELAKLQSQLETTGIKIGAVLLPVVAQLATALTPILTKLAAWIEKNPELTAQIVKGVAMFAAANIAISALAFGVSGTAKTFGFLSKGFGIISKAARFFGLAILKPSLLIRLFRLKLFRFIKVLRLIGTTMAWLGRLLIANPIGIAVMAIAGAAFLVYKNWEPIKAFFIKLWAGVSAAFASAWEFISGVGNRFFNAGKNIIKSLWDGMKSLAMKPVEIMANIVGKIRDYLPFSPAKVGPFRDLHRVKIVETIAQSMKPRPAVAAMQRTVNDMAGVAPSLSPSISGGGGSGVSIVFQPSITLNGGGTGGNIKDQILEGLRTYSGELLTMIEDAKSRRDRTKF